MIYAPLALLLLTAQPSPAELERVIDAGGDEALLAQIGAIKGADYAADEKVEVARLLMAAARQEDSLALSLEIGNLAISLDETFEGRLFLARQELKANELSAAAGHLDRALALQPDDRNALMERAAIAKRVGDFVHAAALYEKAAADQEARACRELDERRFLQEVKDSNQQSSRQASKAVSRAGSGKPGKASGKASGKTSNTARPKPTVVAPAQPRTSSFQAKKPRQNTPPPAPIPVKRRRALREVTDATFVRTVQASPLPVLVLFEAPWCHPCQALNAELARLAPGYMEQLNIVSLNIETAAQTRDRQGVRSVPQLLLFIGKATPRALPTDLTQIEAELRRRFPARAAAE
ncbi:MAG: thioredoxin [Myxococcales bacterium]|jgi:thioredoxin 1|nr:thioredoxin [Myxococcales bacterium]